MSLASLPNPSTRKQSVTLTAFVGPAKPASDRPSGQVQFFEGKKKLGTATLENSEASITISFGSMGQHVLTATYVGDTNFLGGTAAPLTQTVTR
jgi:large repetitive protein